MLELRRLCSGYAITILKKTKVDSLPTHNDESKADFVNSAA